MGHISRLVRPLLFYTLSGLFAAGILFVYLHREAVASQLNAWNVLPQPERLTELYFTDHANLPALFSPGDLQSVEFTIRNQELQSTDYRYLLIAVSPTDNQEVLGEGRVTLDDGASQNITRAIKMPAWNRVKVQVQLEYTSVLSGQHQPGLQTQTIYHWLEVADMAT